MRRKAKKKNKSNDNLSLAEGIGILLTLDLLGALGFGFVGREEFTNH